MLCIRWCGEEPTSCSMMSTSTDKEPTYVISYSSEMPSCRVDMLHSTGYKHSSISCGLLHTRPTRIWQWLCFCLSFCELAGCCRNTGAACASTCFTHAARLHGYRGTHVLVVDAVARRHAQYLLLLLVFVPLLELPRHPHPIQNSTHPPTPSWLEWAARLIQ